jgi:hypothetical protein
MEKPNKDNTIKSLTDIIANQNLEYSQREYLLGILKKVLNGEYDQYFNDEDLN